MTAADPFLLDGRAPLPGRVKVRAEDFRVDELPQYEPCGEGTHTWIRIEKRGLDTNAAGRRLARALGVRPSAVGRAGLKDARAVTTQWLSVEHVEPERARALEVDGLRVLEVTRHGNKLRRGHLRGNRFRIRLRETDVARLGEVRDVLAELARRGFPNRFGPQRFGHRGDADATGAALLAGDAEEAVALLCGRAGPRDAGAVLEARRLFDDGRWEEAAARFPAGFRDAAELCRALVRADGDREAAVAGMDPRLRTLYVSAWQSRRFNAVLAARLAAPDLSIEAAVPGDVAVKHPTGAAFLVEAADEADVRARAAAFEVSPSGPLPGPRTLRPEGAPRALEDAVVGDVLADEDLLARVGRSGCRGGRRPLRERPEDWAASAGEDEHGEHLELAFTIARGTYATALLRELCGREVG